MVDQPRGSRWDDLVADLDGQADAFEVLEDHADAAEIARAELASVSLVERMRSGIGHELVVAVRGAGPVRGVLVGVGRDWLLLDDRVRETLVRLVTVLSVGGLGSRAASDQVVSVVESRWGIGQVLRRHVRDRASTRVVLDTGDVVTGTVDMVGSDHLEIAEHPLGELRRRAAVTARRVIPFDAVSTVSRTH